jgi:hypothetical protein
VPAATPQPLVVRPPATVPQFPAPIVVRTSPTPAVPPGPVPLVLVVSAPAARSQQPQPLVYRAPPSGTSPASSRGAMTAGPAAGPEASAGDSAGVVMGPHASSGSRMGGGG